MLYMLDVTVALVGVATLNLALPAPLQISPSKRQSDERERQVSLKVAFDISK